MFDAATKVLGPLSAVIANAGVVAPTAKLAEMSVERMRRVFEVNVLGAYLTAREATRRMSKSFGGAGGSIVMMSSAAARLGSPNLYVDYAGSKGAIDTLTLGLAEGVRVNAIRPGLIDTDIHAGGGEPDRARILGATAPMERPGTAEESAEAAVWLISDAVLCHLRAARRCWRAVTVRLQAHPPRQGFRGPSACFENRALLSCRAAGVV
jgi:NAD(P)-dependent dehydrogenase (short-subunit alcohol dehydrogenase family)